MIDLWDEGLSHPISYTDYVKYHLCPDIERSAERKNEQKVLISKVVNVLKERNHPGYEEAQAIFDRAMRAIEALKLAVFPSFFKLIHYLDESGFRYTILFRTFGPDAPETANELNQELGDEFIAEFHTIRKGAIDGKEELYGYILKSNNHFAVQDDWKVWYQNNEEGAYGKYFPIDRKDRTRLSLFFDDNARIDLDRAERNAVRPYDAATGEKLSVIKLVDERRVFPVSTLEALCDEDYFIKLVESALETEL